MTEANTIKRHLEDFVAMRVSQETELRNERLHHEAELGRREREIASREAALERQRHELSLQRTKFESALSAQTRDIEQILEALNFAIQARSKRRISVKFGRSPEQDLLHMSRLLADLVENRSTKDDA